MSRMTPHNLTDIIVDGFLRSNTKSHLVLAGHIPDNEWFRNLKKNSDQGNVTFLGLVRDQDYLTQILLNSRAYLHGHSLGGINPALVRVTGMDKPVICVDTVFNREVVESPNNKLQACVFLKNSDSVAKAINDFERNEVYYNSEAKVLGAKVRETMSWEIIYQHYKKLFESSFQ
jgi:glycosyltransferase involved in cell wall biosynthesis